MKYIVDASVAAKWFVEEVGTPQARAVLDSGVVLLAPELILAEVASVAWKKQMRAEISSEHGGRMVRALPHMFDSLYESRELASRALEIAVALNHPIYDCFYLALAEQESARLITDDKRLLRVLQGTDWTERVAALSAFVSPA